MKLFFIKKYFSKYPEFLIKDEKQKLLNEIKTEISKECITYNIFNDKQILMGAMKSCYGYDKYEDVYSHGSKIGEFRYHDYIFNHEIEFSYLDWSIKRSGVLWWERYMIYSNDKLIISLHKKKLTWNPTYELDIDKINEIEFISLICFCIERMRKDANRGP